ncbi:BspA family leucine-rich repeat surface protein [Flavobacteriaceae bacterium 3-367]
MKKILSLRKGKRLAKGSSPALHRRARTAVLITITGFTWIAITGFTWLEVPMATPALAAPIARNDNVTIHEDIETEIDVLDNDSADRGLRLGVDPSNINNELNGQATAVPSDRPTAIDFLPDTDFHGNASFTYRATDENNAVSNEARVRVTVVPVNDAPSFSLVADPDQTVNENADLQTVADFAFGFSAGPENEGTQTLISYNVTVTEDLNNLFAAPSGVSPTIDLDGKLTYRPAANAHGRAKVAVTVRDSGGTERNGVDTSEAQTFTIRVNEVDNTPDAQFITTWRTTSANEQITIPTTGTGYNYTVDWGDGQSSAGQTGNASHSYSTAGEHTVTITGTFPRVFFNNRGDKDKIRAVTQWGNNPWTSMKGAFYGCGNLRITATDVPDLSGVDNMSQMFARATAINTIPNMEQWDVGSVTDMGAMFLYANNFNQDIRGWDVGKVTNMVSMFDNATSFDQDIGNWNTSAVTRMRDMFFNATSFNQDIGRWDVGAVIDMNGMFRNATSFDQNLGRWDVSKVANMRAMFTGVSLSVFNYSALLEGWASQSVRNNVLFHGGGSQYIQESAADTARTKLINEHSWDIIDGGPVSPFVSTWRTDMDNERIDLPLVASGTYNFEVHWGDGTFSTITAHDQAIHTYETAGSYEITITGEIVGWNFSSKRRSREKITGISVWGPLRLGNTGGYFSGCENLQITVDEDDVLDTSGTTNFRNAFQDCKAITIIPGIQYWEMGHVTNLQRMFVNAINFDQNIGDWNISAVTEMRSMFGGVTLSTPNYDALLRGWEAQDVKSNVRFHGGGSKYALGSDADMARTKLINEHNWTIIDGGAIDTAPTVSSIVRFDPDNPNTPPNEITNSNSVTFHVTFSEPVQNVDATDFTTSGTTSQTGDISVQATTEGNNAVYLVTVPGLDGDGKLGLGFADGQDIKDLTNNALTSPVVLPADAQNYTLDNTAPDAPVITSPMDGTATNITAQTIRGTAEAGTTVTATFGTNTQEVIADSEGNWMTAEEITLVEGTNTITATARDALGNISVATSIAITLDITLPAPPVISSPTHGTITNSVAQTVSGTAEAGAKVSVYIGTNTQEAIADSEGNWMTAEEITLVEGLNIISVAQTDLAGNTSAPASIDVILDVTAPAAPVIDSPTDGTITNSAAQTVSGVAEARAQVTVEVTSGDRTVSYGPVTAESSGGWDVENVTLTEGSNTITVLQTDLAGNPSPRATSITVTLDTIAPIITLLTGTNPQSIVVGMAYTELGATAFDNVDGDISSRIIIDISSVNTNTIGSYEVTYNVSDATGNPAVQVTRTVNVVDPTTPVITLLGDNPQTIEAGTTYTELGATAVDDVDGDISSNITIDASSVDTNTVGSYTVTYDVSDAAGNPAVQVVRTIIVVDTTAPVITLAGANPQVIVVGTAYTELGATAVDNVDGDISSNITIDDSSVDTGTLGSYMVTYNVSDAAGNAAVEVIRTVVIKDNADPKLSKPIEDQQLSTGTGDHALALAEVFEDADGDQLTYSALSDNEGVVTVKTEGSKLTFTTVGTGTATITVTADDGFGGTIIHTFKVEVVCAIEALPADNFQLRATGETCGDKDNGSIRITAGQELEYTATINNNGHEFSKTLEIKDLSPGSYSVCIAIKGSACQQCFELEIDEGPVLAGKTTVNKTAGLRARVGVEIASGKAPYTVRVNDKIIGQYGTGSFSVTADPWDKVEVLSSVACEGKLVVALEGSGRTRVSKNPAGSQVEFIVPGMVKDRVAVDIYDVSGARISSEIYPVSNRKVVVGMEQLEAGVYLVYLGAGSPRRFKVIKE